MMDFLQPKKDRQTDIESSLCFVLRKTLKTVPIKPKWKGAGVLDNTVIDAHSEGLIQLTIFLQYHTNNEMFASFSTLTINISGMLHQTHLRFSLASFQSD